MNYVEFDDNLYLKKYTTILKENKLDEESIIKYQSEIKKVSKEESLRLGKELLDTIVNIRLKKYLTNDLITKVESLIKNGAYLEYRDMKGDFPLLICAKKNYYQLVYLLLRAGANVNLTNDYLTTPLMTAARHDHVYIVSVLLALGADPNLRCKDGDTALMSAKRHNSYNSYEYLVNYNAYINNMNNKNETIVDINCCCDVPQNNKLYHNVKNYQFDNLIGVKQEVEEKISSYTDSMDLIEKARSELVRVKKL